ncbi:MAG TPA: S9 family peptidase, partial [Lacipirellulaceae bacterium]|nr:S9 family peptidase [Lacipirellulaceae bacterium]
MKGQVHWIVAYWCAMSLTVLATAQAATNSTKLEYPEARRVKHVDTYFGVKVPDPYRWLEADVRESPEVAEWVKKENTVARAYLDAIPQRSAIEKRLTELWNYERYSPPVQKGGKYFYLKNDGLQNQPVLYVADSYSDDGRMLVDPNMWSKDGTIAMSTFRPSEDGRLVAYSRSEAGSDWQQIYVLDVKTGKTFADHIKWCRFTEIEWTKDGSGFYYNRYPEPPAGKLHQTAALNQMV